MKKARKGFTLIELLIVIAIIAILAAIAIPQFSAYRRRAYNSSAESDLRNTKTAEEALFADVQYYGKSGATAQLPGAGGYGAGALYSGPLNAATANQAGALLTTNDQAGNARGVGIGVGARDDLEADTDANGASYIILTEHGQGNTGYGTDSDGNAIYYCKNDAFIGTPGVINSTNPGANPNQDDFTATPACGGSPVANWTPQ